MYDRVSVSYTYSTVSVLYSYLFSHYIELFILFPKEFANHSHALIATIERNTESSDPSHMYSIKLLKQKQFIEGCLLILQVQISFS